MPKPDPKPVRERMREDLEAMYPEVVKMLREAGKATKKVWLNCPHCNKGSHASVPDAKAALDVAEFFANQGFGRPGVAENENPQPIVFENKIFLVAEDE